MQTYKWAQSSETDRIILGTDQHPLDQYPFSFAGGPYLDHLKFFGFEIWRAPSRDNPFHDPPSMSAPLGSNP